MEGEHIPLILRVWEESLDSRVGGVSIHLFRYEAQAYAHAVEVGIYGEEGALHGEEEHAGRRLRPHSAKALQPSVRLIQGHLVQEREIEAAALLLYPIEDSFDAWGFLLRPRHPRYRLLYLLYRGVTRFLPRCESLAKTIVGAPGRGVGCAVRQEYLDQHPHRVEHGPLRLSVLRPQEREHRPCLRFERLKFAFGLSLLHLRLYVSRRRRVVRGGPLFPLVSVDGGHSVPPVRSTKAGNLRARLFPSWTVIPLQ